MRAVREWIAASGYLAILLPPLLLYAGTVEGHPLLSFVALVIVTPLLRVVFGDAAGQAPEWSERVATVLHFLPHVAAVAYVAAIAGTLLHLHQAQQSFSFLIALGASLWATCVFGSCVSHELIHRREAGAKVLGRILSGLIGYPLLEHEHRAHHASSGNSTLPEWPQRDESVWSFTARRLHHAVRSAWTANLKVAQRSGRAWRGGLEVSIVAFACTCTSFAWAIGWTGAALYASTAAVVLWSMQAITFIQHWGLGEDSVRDSELLNLGWEDHCRLQAWLTLSISFHQAHHHGHGAPYYRLAPQENAPRQPGGYVVLLLASLCPPVWRALMVPALTRWKLSPTTQPSAGRRLVCVVR